MVRGRPPTAAGLPLCPRWGSILLMGCLHGQRSESSRASTKVRRARTTATSLYRCLTRCGCALTLISFVSPGCSGGNGTKTADGATIIAETMGKGESPGAGGATTLEGTTSADDAPSEGGIPGTGGMPVVDTSGTGGATSAGGAHGTGGTPRTGGTGDGATDGSVGDATEEAAACVPLHYISCVGDGRDPSAATCAYADYTYFKVEMSFSQSSSSSRSQVTACYLEIADSLGNSLAKYLLPSGQDYGCAAGLTPADIGFLSYSSCCAVNESLQFTLLATSADNVVLETGTSTGSCSEKGGSNEVEVNLVAN